VPRKLTKQPPGLFTTGLKHLFVLAHQDDDLPYSGLMRRALPDAHVTYVTNGDGLAPMADMDPEEYATIRENESIAALGILGYGRDQLTFLRHSELFFYPLFIEVERAGPYITGPLADKIRGVFGDIASHIKPQVEAADVVWTMAWQGGHPEHDLTHFITAQVVREVEREQGRTIPFYEFPAYEIIFFVPLRFAPWSKGISHRITLTPEEMAVKESCFDAYASQVMITNAFKKLLRLYGVISALRLKPFGFKDFASVEEFGPVPSDRDYTLSPHRWQLFDYIKEDYEGDRVSFFGSVAPIVRLL